MILERVKIITHLNGLDNVPNILLDVSDFFHKIKSFDEYESMSVPDGIVAENYENIITFDWTKIENKNVNTLSISFSGDKTINIEASYPEMDIIVKNNFPLNDDMANFVTTHLNNFKQPLKKKRYK